MYKVGPKEWMELFTNAAEREALVSLLTNFQRYVRHLKPGQLLLVAERSLALGIRENRERVDVHHVLLAEILHRLLHENERALSVAEIARLCRLLHRLKFNRDPEGAPTAPVCSGIFEFGKGVAACEGCRERYGEVLGLTGGDLVAVLMVVLGRSLLAQSRGLRRRHENAVVPYLVLVGSRNAVICSHLVRDICLQYRAQFLATNSIRSLGILLHTIRRTRARVGPVERELVGRLAGPGVVEGLLHRETSTGARLAAVGQVLQFCMNTRCAPTAFSRQLDSVACRLVKHVAELFAGEDADRLEDFPRLVSQLTLLGKCAAVERTRLGGLLREAGLSGFLAELERFTPSFEEDDFRTSNIHVQVDSVLRAFNYETRLEHYLSPYVVDIFVPARNAVVEVDGPCHYATCLSERVNTILRRPVADFRLQYGLNSRLKRRLLLRLGHRVVNIPFFRWPSAPGEQVQLVSRLGL